MELPLGGGDGVGRQEEGLRYQGQLVHFREVVVVADREGPALAEKEEH